MRIGVSTYTLHHTYVYICFSAHTNTTHTQVHTVHMHKYIPVAPHSQTHRPTYCTVYSNAFIYTHKLPLLSLSSHTLALGLRAQYLPHAEVTGRSVCLTLSRIPLWLAPAIPPGMCNRTCPCSLSSSLAPVFPLLPLPPPWPWYK